MMFTSKLLSAALAALTSFSTVGASPLLARDVFNPPVTDPHTGTVWVIGTTTNVTWDASNPPPRIAGTSLISLVKNNSILIGGPGSLNNPLAVGFSLLTGTQEITVPEAEPGNDYRVVLFGSSDNWSEVFTITQ